MGISKREGKTPRYEVFVYDPSIKRKRYVGCRTRLGDAKELYAAKTAELRGEPAKDELTVADYAARWLEYKHGENTRRPSPTTRQVNESSLRPFLRDFGDRLLRGIDRAEALDWARKNNRVAKSVSAMFNDALDDDLVTVNPFANRRNPQPRGRKDIHPVTEAEVVRLGQIAADVWGPVYGSVCRAWITFGAWVGARPGEYFAMRWPDLDFAAGTVRIPRIKGRKQTDTVVFPRRAQEAIRGMVRIENSRDLVFPTVSGVHAEKGASRYYWDPVRKAFLAQLDPGRREELTDSKGALDLYALRHFCASQMADAGLTEFDIAHQLGNSPEVCREVYVHVYRDRTNMRVALALDGNVTDLDAARRRRIGGDK